jgi:4-diphosphocytidyl-2-C-methyl-D-erythritol kinase
MRIAARVGADIPFFLAPGPQLGTGDGTELEPLDLPLDYHIVLLLPTGVEKASTAAVYDAFDQRAGEEGFEARRQELLDALGQATAARHHAALPRNELASSPLAAEFEGLGAFRADVSGAGPAVYGLFEREEDGLAAAAALDSLGATWICAPTWYG